MTKRRLPDRSIQLRSQRSRIESIIRHRDALELPERTYGNANLTPADWLCEEGAVAGWDGIRERSTT
jgi:hypothetical protein